MDYEFATVPGATMGRDAPTVLFHDLLRHDLRSIPPYPFCRCQEYRSPSDDCSNGFVVQLTGINAGWKFCARIHAPQMITDNLRRAGTEVASYPLPARPLLGRSTKGTIELDLWFVQMILHVDSHGCLEMPAAIKCNEWVFVNRIPAHRSSEVPKGRLSPGFCPSDKNPASRRAG